MDITPRQTTAIVTFVVLIVLYCMPVLLLGWYLWSIGLSRIEYAEPIPQMVVTFNSGTGDKATAGAAPDLLGMLHRVLVPVATLISGLLSVTLSRSRLNYVLIGILLFLIILVFAVYVMFGTSAGAGGEVDTSRSIVDDTGAVARIAISTVLSRTFDTLFSFVLLFLGIAVGAPDKPSREDAPAGSGTGAHAAAAITGGGQQPDNNGARP